MSRLRYRRYVLAIAIAIAVVALEFLFPYLRLALPYISGCGAGGRDCSSVDAWAELVLLPSAIWIAAGVMIAMTWWRLATSGFSRLWIVPVALWLLGSFDHLAGPKALTGLGYGITPLEVPYHLAFLVGFVLLLCIRDAKDFSHSPRYPKDAWTVATIAAILGLLLFPTFLVAGLLTLPFVGYEIAPYLMGKALSIEFLLAKWGLSGPTFLTIDLLIFLAALAYLHFGCDAKIGGAGDDLSRQERK